MAGPGRSSSSPARRGRPPSGPQGARQTRDDGGIRRSHRPTATDARAGLRVMTVLEAAARSLALDGAFVNLEDLA